MAQADKLYDLCVIGGGINGVGIARDASGRGLSVLLLEAQDLAAATSSSSTKLIHGGLRYLEYYDFRLVRDALQERERLLSIAPHIIWPLRFVIPHVQRMRPSWLIRLGLFVYDHLARRNKILASRALSLSGMGLKSAFDKGFVYSDCWADDARLVALNAMDAKLNGADIKTYSPCVSIEGAKDGWRIKTEAAAFTARMIVNAAGPWVEQIISMAGLENENLPSLRLVKGSHIIVKKVVEGERAFLLQQQDGRIVFIIPYEKDFTLIGTTEEEFSGSPYGAKISNGEIEYLCAAFNAVFEKQITADDVEWAYSGVRALVEDGSKNARAVTRDYRLVMHEGAPHSFLSVFGGKLTTYRSLAEKAVNMLTDTQGSWTAEEALPGGDIEDFEEFLEQQKQKYSQYEDKFLYRLARSYGTKMDDILSGDLDTHFGDDVYEAEIRYLVEHEFAKRAEDILWRRSKLGLHVSEETVRNLKEFLDE